MTNDLRTVAIVDDHALIRDMTRKCLQLLGFIVVLEASNGMALLELLSTCAMLPAICLLDVEMPMMDGYATARALRVRYPEMKIVAYTLIADAEKEKRLLEAGARMVLLKRIEPEEMKEALLRILRD